MKTQVLSPTKVVVQKAAKLIRQGELVAFPTETVYGLGANALDPKAVKKIFAAKGRPSDNPLIVHIASREQLSSLVESIPSSYKMLMKTFWPGPLTLIFPKSELVPSEITAGGNTVAIRWPCHPVAQRLILESGVPVAAPSANLSGKPSPTRAKHVLEDLRGKIPLILDGGPTEIGLESTVLDMTGDQPILLRTGAVTVEELQKTLRVPLSLPENMEGAVRSPGMKYRHYAPKAKVILVKKVNQKLIDTYQSTYKKIGVIALRNNVFSPNVIYFSSDNTTQLASQLFSILREMDTLGCNLIIFESISSRFLGRAIVDRITRAAQA